MSDEKGNLAGVKPFSKSAATHLSMMLCLSEPMWSYSVVVSMFDFHRSDRGSNPGRGGIIS